MSNTQQQQQESSLTAPEDRIKANKWKPDQTSPPLTVEQGNEAIQVLSNTDCIDRFPQIDRRYVDPVLNQQHIGLFSFIPSKGATPNEQGIFGFAKLRGNFGSEIEANECAENLIRNHDSYHTIYHTRVGAPFPVTCSSKFSSDVNEVDLKKETVKAVSNSVKDKRNEEQKTIQDMRIREENLLAESKRAEADEDEDPFENYITLSVKKAQLTFTYLEHQKKMTEVKNIIINTREVLEQLDSEFPDFKDKYFQKYMDARRASGFKDDDEMSKDNFLKYMCEEADIGF